MAYPYESDRAEVLSRLRKIEGQIRGVGRMVSEEKPCVDVLTQVSAVISGMEKVGLRLLRDHLTERLREGASSKDPRTSIDDAVRTVERFLQT